MALARSAFLARKFNGASPRSPSRSLGSLNLPPFFVPRSLVP